MARRLIAVQKNKEIKMQKTTTIFGLVLLLVILSTIQLIWIKPASANVGSAVFCPNYYVDQVDTEEELQLSEDTCTYIRNMLANRYASGCYYSYNEDCTVNSYCSILSSLDGSGSIDEVVSFSKGHRGLPYYYWPIWNINHISLLDHHGADVEDDFHIHSSTSSKNTFSFIWHCETAERYPEGYNYPDAYGYYGMPYCWSHNGNMACYGGSGDVVFLGWVDGSPQFETQAEGTWNYAHIAYYFWYYMCDGYTVEGTLDKIAQEIFGDYNYLESPLCDWLLLWGDKTMNLPED